MKRLIFIAIFALALVACQQERKDETPPIQVAFMADVHLQDIFGSLSDSDYKGVKIPGSEQWVIARTMQAQLNSTRLFNENYFAFKAALDDVVSRHIKYVVLPGDFSDDGQPINIRGVKTILQAYTQAYGLQFILATGNHDAVRPFTGEAGKKDFIGSDGSNQAIMSSENLYTPNEESLPLVISQDLRKLGYQETIEGLRDFGFYPKASDVYWESPFSTYDVSSYNYDTAATEAAFEKRYYEIAEGVSVPDVSYLVEPEEGLWFLSIDANVYIPKGKGEFGGSSVGYNEVLSHKKHLINWVTRVCEEADKRGKQLIVFSHYPMVDFNDDASDHIKQLMGDGKAQLYRVPNEDVSKAFAEAGVRIHFGGHMHINDTGVRTYGDIGLVNIQIPSLAAYVPGYKIANLNSDHTMGIATVILDSVPGFNRLFPLYEKEYEYLKANAPTQLWDKEILNAKSYYEYTTQHLKGLVQHRFLEKDWPQELKNYLLQTSGYEMLLPYVKEIDKCTPDEIAELKNWTGEDLIFDFYRLRSADQLAFDNIGLKRLNSYQKVLKLIISEHSTSSKTTRLQQDLYEFSCIFVAFMNGAPSDTFRVDTKTGRLIQVD